MRGNNNNLALQMDLFSFDPKAEKSEGPELTVLCYGCGQDSTTLLYRYALDPEFRRKYAPNRFVVLMAETGDEHPATYAHLAFTKEFCKQHGIEFIHIVPSMGYHGANWQSLRGFYNALGTCGSKAFPKTCTDRLKLQPIYGFLEDWLEDNYGVKSGKKKGYVEFARRHGRIRIIIGIAKGEERRVADPTLEPHLWKRHAIEMSYPLVELGLDRAGCQAYMREVELPCPPPSNCILCPFMSEIELLWLYKFMREDYEDWCRIEAVKLAKNAHMNAVEVTDKKGRKKTVNKNLGVWGEKTLPQKMEEVLEKYGHMDDTAVHLFKMSHGHCVMSKY